VGCLLALLMAIAAFSSDWTSFGWPMLMLTIAAAGRLALAPRSAGSS
jgi:hypothetical protein